MSSLIDRITEKNRFDNLLNIQNDRMSKFAKKRENVVLQFKPVDEELLREYNEQFPKGFEVVDEEGNKTYRKFIPPQFKPDLEEMNLLHTAPDSLVKDAIRARDDILPKEIRNLKLELTRNRKDKELLIEGINEGLYTKGDAASSLMDIEEAFDDIKYQIQRREDELMNIDNFLKEQKNREKENESTKAVVGGRNKQKVKAYQDELNVLNKGSFTSEQLPSETEAEYYERLKNNAELTTPEENLDNAKVLTLKRFNEKMKEIIRSSAKIEQISNTIDKFGEVSNKLKVLKKWNLFKTKFSRIFGINNPSLSVDDIISFIYSFLDENSPESKELRKLNIGEDEEVIDFETKPLVKVEVQFNTLILIGLDNRELFLKPASVEQSRFILLYSFTGERGSFKDWIDKKYPNDRTMSSSSEVEMRTGLTLDDLQSVLGARNTDIMAGNIIKKFNITPLLSGEYTEETYYVGKKQSNSVSRTTYGYGIIPEKIPEKVNFGKVMVLLPKLTHKNILSVKHHNGLSIAGFRNVKVSDKFVNLILEMLKNKLPTHNDLTSLSIMEKQLYDRLIFLAELNKKMVNNQDKTISDLKKRIKLIEGELHAGNNSPLLKKELYTILHTLKDFGHLSKKQITEYLNEI